MKTKSLTAFNVFPFLSHLSGDEVGLMLIAAFISFLSHLSGDEVSKDNEGRYIIFLSHLSGDEA